MWRNRAKTIMNADHVYPFLSGRKRNKLQVSGVNGVDKISGYRVRSFFLVDAVLVADHELYASPPVIHHDGKVLDLRRLIDVDDGQSERRGQA